MEGKASRGPGRESELVVGASAGAGILEQKLSFSPGTQQTLWRPLFSGQAPLSTPWNTFWLRPEQLRLLPCHGDSAIPGSGWLSSSSVWPPPWLVQTRLSIKPKAG